MLFSLRESLRERRVQNATPSSPPEVRTQHPGLGARAHTYDTYRGQELRGGANARTGPARAAQARKYRTNHEFHEIS